MTFSGAAISVSIKNVHVRIERGKPSGAALPVSLGFVLPSIEVTAGGGIGASVAKSLMKSLADSQQARFVVPQRDPAQVRGPSSSMPRPSEDGGEPSLAAVVRALGTQGSKDRGGEGPRGGGEAAARAGGPRRDSEQGWPHAGRGRGRGR